MHEDLSRTEEVKSSSDRTFGLTIACFLMVVALAPLLHAPAGPIRWWALGVAAGFAGLAAVRPETLAPLNRLWLGVGLVLFKVVNPVVLGLLFYSTITPLGWIIRSLGKDPLRLRREPEVQSYWIVRTPAGPPPQSMKNQF